MSRRPWTWIIGFIGLATLSAAQLARAGDLKIKAFNAAGEDLSNPVIADDHLVAVLSYEKTETTHLCGAKMGRTLMKITVHADGGYSGVETSSRLECPRSGPVRKAFYSKHEGKLSMADLARLWHRLGEITAQSRDLAAAAPATLLVLAGQFQAHIQVAPDLRGVLSERQLPEIVQSGRAAEASVRFMQAFILEGKIN